MDNARAAAVPCPICRTPYRKNQLVRNQLAYQLINDLQIFCSNRGCAWKGPTEQLKQHLPNCQFGDGHLPEWYKRYLKSRESEFEQEELAHDMLDDALRDKLKQEIQQPLALRLYARVS